MSAESPEKLIAAIDELTAEVKMFRKAMEEFRVCFEWVLHNGRLRCGAEEAAPLSRSAGGESAGGAAESNRERTVAIEIQEKLAFLTLVVEEIRSVVDRVVPKAQGSYPSYQLRVGAPGQRH